MINRLRGLFQRYASQHRHIEAPGFALGSPDRPRGYVDKVVMQGTRVRFIGWSTADRVLLTSADGQTATRPNLVRQDVADALGMAPRVGFEIAQPYGDGRFSLTVEQDGVQERHDIAPIPPWMLRRSRLRLALRFAGALMHAGPAIVRYGLTRSPQARRAVKLALDLRAVPEAGPMETRLFVRPEAEEKVPDPVPVTLILPVYNAFDLLPEVLDRVRRNTDLPWHLIVIEDCSTDPQVRPWLRDWVAACEAEAPGRVTLVEHETNQGFIGAVNGGLERALARGDHVVLLNSDAFVPDGWASRLIRPILMHEDVASVTPMSNDAEIFSVPLICTRTVLQPGQGDAIDAVAQRFHPEATLSVVPTGVGFCMAMNIEYLREIHTLDPVFGRGYGEEVDWCQRARALGGRHLGLPGLFVEHRGGESFGSAEKQTLMLANGRVISNRYPTYDGEVQQFIAADPLNTARVALAVAWAAAETGGALPVYLAHALGGGAERYLERRIATELETTGTPALILRVGGSARWQLEVVAKAGRVAGTTDDFAFVAALLEPVAQRQIVYSCGVGDSDPVTLPDDLLKLRRGGTDRIEVLVHDYFMLSPSYTLLDADGVYRGPVPETRTDPAHAAARPGGATVPLTAWRAAWGRLMRAADDIVVFSEDSRAHVLEAYPDTGGQVRLRPHSLLTEVPRLTRPAGSRRVIGVLGDIGYQKGAAVVAELGRLAEREPDLSLALIGNVDPAWAPPASVPIHGSYDIADLPLLAARYGVTDWLIPSIWPETFSYTTHECLATGLPTYAFDIGAQGEAVARAPNGHAIRFAPGGQLAVNVLDTLKAEAAQTRDE